MVRINFSGREGSYFFECNKDGRCLYVASTSFWIAVSKRLVDFFGVSIDFNDSDSVEVDYSVPWKTREENAPTDGEAWNIFQKRLAAVPRINRNELTGDDWYTYRFDDEGFMINGE